MGLNNCFSGIPEDYTNYRWYKGEQMNPYTNDTFHPLAASFWEYERIFHLGYLGKADTNKSLTEAYNKWKEEFINDYYPVNLQIPMVTTPTGKRFLKRV